MSSEDKSDMLQLLFGSMLGQTAILSLLMSEGLISQEGTIAHLENLIEQMRSQGALKELEPLSFLLKQVKGIKPPPLDS